MSMGGKVFLFRGRGKRELNDDLKMNWKNDGTKMK
jgi:hypothetical protein